MVKYAGILYGIIKVKYKNNFYPVLLDIKDYRAIKKLNKIFYVDLYGQVYCTHKYKNIEKKIYIHHVILALHNETYLNTKGHNKVKIYHANNIYLDNRFSNLTQTPPTKTKSRTIEIIDNNVTVSMLPKYVTYMRPNKTHGERFQVFFNGINWKSSSSKKLSLKYKLEQTKKFLRIILTIPAIRTEYHKEQNRQIIKTMRTYNAIVRKAGYVHIKQKINNTINNCKLLRYSATGLTNVEKDLLKKFVVDLDKLLNK